MSYQKRHPFYPVLCYHGCVRTRAEVNTYWEALPDFVSQVENLMALGYTFVLPSVYMTWYNGTYDPPTPIACIHIDDGLDIGLIMADYLISRGLPLGLSLITARQHKHKPEDDFASWASIKARVDTGLAEVLCHTHNMHSLCLSRDANTFADSIASGRTVIQANGDSISSEPILQGPSWVDNGDAIHVPAGDPRYAWDYSFTDTSWGFPLIGCDPYDGFNTKLVSTITFESTSAFALHFLRFMGTLTTPGGVGYNAQVAISLNGQSCGNVNLVPKNYGTRTQWPEREFISFVLPTARNVVVGTNTLTFTTLNQGNFMMRAYFNPDVTSPNYAVTNCQSLVTGQLGASACDRPAGYHWLGNPLMILGDGTGAQVSDATFTGYVQADIVRFQADVQNWLNAVWTMNRNPVVVTVTENGELEFGIAAWGTWVDGSAINTWWRLNIASGSVIELLRFRMAYASNAGVVLAGPYSCVIEISLTDTYLGATTVVYTGSASWAQGGDWAEYDITPYTTAGTWVWIQIRTLTISPFGPGIARMFVDAQMKTPPSMDWDTSWWSAPYTDSYPGLYNQTPRYGARAPWIEAGTVVRNAAPAPVQMIYPFGASAQDSIATAKTPNLETITAPLKTALIGGGCNCGFTITPKRASRPGDLAASDERNDQWAMGRMIVYGTNPPSMTIQHEDLYAGQLYPDVYHGGVKWASAMEPDPQGNGSIHQSYPILNEMHFDAYFPDAAGHIIKKAINDGGTYFSLTTPPGSPFTAGRTLTGVTSAATATIVWYSELNIKIIVTGGTFVANEVVTESISALTATIDETAALTYADDKTFLQGHGVECYLILYNFNPSLDDIDPDIGAYVVNNPSIYIPLFVNLVMNVAGEWATPWDGMMFDIEGIPVTWSYASNSVTLGSDSSGNRAAATAFLQQLYAALQAVGKKLCTVAPLRTGTAYDVGSESFWGWCDFGAVIECCDQLLVTSYLESNNGPTPLPHCSNLAFEQCYDYVQRVTYNQYWYRIRVGTNAYGEYWPNKNNASVSEYCTYAVSYFNAIYGAALIVEEEGEGHYLDRLGGEGWFATPATIQRAVTLASKRGFGGVFVWKSDDGNKYEFWPNAPTEKENFVAFVEEYFPVAQSFFPVYKPSFDVAVSLSSNKVESRVATDGGFPLSKITLQARDVLPNIGTQKQDFDNLLNHFLCVGGMAIGFRLIVPGDSQLTNQQIGVGDGSTKNFQIVQTRTFGGMSITKNIYKIVSGVIQGITYTYTVYANGVAQSSGFSVDLNFGFVSFAVAPAGGVVITITCTFAYAARYDSKEFPMAFDMDYGSYGFDEMAFQELHLNISAGSVVVASGGTGYAVGDIMQLSSGGVVVQVSTLSGSAVATAAVITPGAVSTVPDNPLTQVTALTGSGSGATFNVTWF